MTATPKFSYIGGDTPEPTDGRTPPDDSLPQTGQLLWPVTLLSELGCLLILGGSALMRKEGSGEKKPR